MLQLRLRVPVKQAKDSRSLPQKSASWQNKALHQPRKLKQSLPISKHDQAAWSIKRTPRLKEDKSSPNSFRKQSSQLWKSLNAINQWQTASPMSNKLAEISKKFKIKFLRDSRTSLLQPRKMLPVQKKFQQTRKKFLQRWTNLRNMFPTSAIFRQLSEKKQINSNYKQLYLPPSDFKIK